MVKYDIYLDSAPAFTSEDWMLSWLVLNIVDWKYKAHKN